MRISRYILLMAVSACLAVCYSCSDDDNWSPSYITDFADLCTDADGNVAELVLDNGSTYQLATPYSFADAKPDTTYRAICLYTVDKEAATLHSVSLTFSPDPIVAPSDLEMKNDPCVIQSIWRGSDYINARMLVQGQEIQHYVAFIDRGITTGSQSSAKILTIELYHDCNNDPAAFTRTFYFSCPLRKYAELLTQGRDSIAFIVNQEDKGMTTFMLPY